MFLSVPFVDLNAALGASVQSAIMRNVQSVIDSRLFLAGPMIAKFEQAWGEYVGAKHCVACSSGTDAVTLAAFGANIAVASIPANCVKHTEIGLEAAGVNVYRQDVTDSGNMLAPPLVAMSRFGVGLYGRWTGLGKYGVIDAAQLHGWRCGGEHTAAWSMYPSKNLGAWGDGGAVTTDSDDVAAVVRGCGSGANIRRMDEIQAAVLLAKLPYLDAWNANRLEIANAYWNGLPSAVTPVVDYSERDQYNGHLFPILLPDRRDEFMVWMKGRGIGTKVHYPALAEGGNFTGTERFCSRVVSLPIWPGMAENQIDHVRTAVADWIKGESS